MSEKLSENSEMSAVEFSQYALRERIAPRSLGSVKARLRHAVRVMGRRQWSANRVRDCWYADQRISPNADEIRDLEEIDRLIARADALLDGSDADFRRPFVDALRALFGASNRTGTEE